jgi:hypothetical protein
MNNIEERKVILSKLKIRKGATNKRRLTKKR